MTDRCPLHGVTDCAPCGLARVRAAIRTRPATQPTDPNPTRARALARARKEKR